MNGPNLIFVLLAWFQPQNQFVIGAALCVEQFGYGLGFAAYLVYMMMVAAGPHQTAHYAICTGFMAMGMMLPGMPAGWLQEQLGYVNFFVWVCVAMLPSLAVTALIKVDPAFGKKA
jgi:PAT family beta-lactamase induction signal transducer AmpG